MTKRKPPPQQYQLPLEQPKEPSRAKEKTQDELCVEEQGIIDHAFEILRMRHLPGQAFSSPEETRQYLRLKLAELKQEVFGCIFLDNRHRVISDEHLFFGTIDGASVYPRVVVQRALEVNAAAVLIYHNHPSGVAEPSQADLRITARLKEALALVEIRLLDHFVVSIEGAASLAECGLM